MPCIKVSTDIEDDLGIRVGFDDLSGEARTSSVCHGNGVADQLIELSGRNVAVAGLVAPPLLAGEADRGLQSKRVFKEDVPALSGTVSKASNEE